MARPHPLPRSLPRPRRPRPCGRRRRRRRDGAAPPLRCPAPARPQPAGAAGSWARRREGARRAAAQRAARAARRRRCCGVGSRRLTLGQRPATHRPVPSHPRSKPSFLPAPTNPVFSRPPTPHTTHTLPTYRWLPPCGAPRGHTSPGQQPWVRSGLAGAGSGEERHVRGQLPALACGGRGGGLWAEWQGSTSGRQQTWVQVPAGLEFPLRCPILLFYYLFLHSQGYCQSQEA